MAGFPASSPRDWPSVSLELMFRIIAKPPCRIVMLFIFACALSASTWAVSKEEIQLQVQLQNLSDQLTRIQKSIDEGIGVMNNLATRNANTVKRLQATLDQLRGQLGDKGTANDKHFEKVTAQLNALGTALNDLKTQVDRALQPRAATTAQPAPQSALSAAAPATPASPVAAGSAAPAPAANPAAAMPNAPSQKPISPPATVEKQELYDSAMESYRVKDFESAALQFTKYLKLDRQSQNAIHAQFYLAQIEFDQSDFEGALEDFTSVGPRLTDPAKAATAQYKKALCLLEVERRDEAIPELQEVIQKYPRSPEARLAARKLRSLQAAR